MNAPVQQMSSQMASVIAGMKDDGSGGAGQGSLMQDVLNGYAFYILPLTMRVSTNLEAIGGYKGVNQPIFQLASNMMNQKGNAVGLASIVMDLLSRLDPAIMDNFGSPEELFGFLETMAQDIMNGGGDIFASMAQISYDDDFDRALAMQSGLKVQSLPDYSIDQFDSAQGMIV